MTSKPRGSLTQRFWAKVDKKGPDECWEWTAALNNRGYGKLGRGGRKAGEIYAHRLSYEIHRGPIREGLVIDHKCRNTKCVNPAHLQAVTHKQNMENVGPNRDGKSGVRGVHWNKNAKKWQAVVRHNDHPRHVGYFDRLEDAEFAVIAKRNELYTNNLTDRKIA